MYTLVAKTLHASGDLNGPHLQYAQAACEIAAHNNPYNQS